MNAAKIKSLWNRQQHTTRAQARLEKQFNLQINFCKHLDRLSNVETVWGGHLKNATCHYTNRWEVSGDTYEVRDFLKKHGFKWDSAKKVWWLESNRVHKKGGTSRLIDALLKHCFGV